MSMLNWKSSINIIVHKKRFNFLLISDKDTKSLTYQELNYFSNALKLITIPAEGISFLGTFNLLILVTST